ncbi:MAG: class I SAM-dependent methyltransferase [bacterium]
MRSERDAFSKFEYDGWQRVAGKYESAWSGLTRLFIPHLLAATQVGAGARVLDVACGPGYVADAARALGALPTGVDFSSEMIRLAQARNPEIRFSTSDAQALDFEDESFDVVVMNFGVVHLSNPESAFAEARRVLRPAGHYGFTVWASPELSPGAKIVEDAIEAHADKNVRLPKGPDYFGYGDAEDCRNTLTRLGFDSISLVFRTVTAQWQVPDAAFVFQAERDAGVRTAALLAEQTPEIQSAIQTQIETAMQSYAQKDGFGLPYAAHVIAVRAV